MIKIKHLMNAETPINGVVSELWEAGNQRLRQSEEQTWTIY
jgi:hypothetical protein